MVNEENECHSHIFEPLFSNHSKTKMLKTKVDIHVFSPVENIFFRHAITRKHYFRHLTKCHKLEDLKVLRRSPDLFYNV